MSASEISSSIMELNGISFVVLTKPDNQTELSLLLTSFFQPNIVLMYQVSSCQRHFISKRKLQ